MLVRPNYKHLRRNREGVLSYILLLERVGCYRKLMPRLGGRKLWHLLQQDGFPVSRDRLFTLLSENNLLVKRRKKYPFIIAVIQPDRNLIE